MLGISWPIGAHTNLQTRLVCPLCSSPLIRIRRRFSDRLLSLIAPVQRYRCSARKEDLSCTWEGIILAQPGDKTGHTHSSKSKVSATSDRDQPQARKMNDPVTRDKSTRDPTQRSRSPIAAFGDLSFEDMAQITLDAIGDAVLVVNPQGEVIYINRVAEKLAGWPRETALGQPIEKVFNIVDGKTRQRAKSPSERAIKEERIVELTLGSVLIRYDGTSIAIEDSAAPIYNRRGQVAGAVIVFHDARQSEFEVQKMSHLAQHDDLTGLPNRVLLRERLTQAIGMAKRHHKQVALLFLDLDFFKQINDSFGHSVGDRLLKEVATDILDCVRTTDTVSRHGGDEFVVLLTEIEHVGDSTQVAEKLLARFARPRIVDGHELKLTLSIGISVYPENGLDADTLLNSADASMYTTKKNGRNNYQVSQ